MSVHSDLERVIRGELDNCERALKNEDVGKALRELRDAISKLKVIQRSASRLERESRQQ